MVKDVTSYSSGTLLQAVTSNGVETVSGLQTLRKELKDTTANG